MNIWEGVASRAFLQELPLIQQHLEKLANVVGGSGYGIRFTSGGTVTGAMNAAKIAVDGLASSIDNAGGKSNAFSQRIFQSAQAIADMGQKAQQAADAGEKVDPKQEIAGMLQIAGAAILTYKERAMVESLYYAAKSAAAFAAQDYWAGAEFALASGLFAEAAGTASKASSGGGGGGSQSSYGRGGSGSSAGGGGSGGGGAATPGSGITVHNHLEGPGWTPEHVVQLMAQMTDLAKSGQGFLIATGAATNQGRLT
jgi:hypothetical protein